MTDTQGARFALDESKAAEFIARGHENYNPANPAFARITGLLVHHAMDESVITDPLHFDAQTLAFEYVGACDESPHGYRWLLSVSTGENPDDYLTLAGPAEDLAAISRSTGRYGALDVLNAAVEAGNILAAELDAYVASLPLTARAPEVTALLDRIKAADWNGADVVDILTDWFPTHGYPGDEDIASN